VAITWVRGEFRMARATLNWNASKLEESRIDVDIDAGSVNTGGPQRDEHLRSDTFKEVYTRLAQSGEASPAELTATGFSVAYSLRKGI
jgi:polyisoprenoid-binding protein YceI